MYREGFYNLFLKRMQDVYEKVWSQQDSATVHTAWISINQGGTGAGKHRNAVLVLLKYIMI